MTHVEQTLGGLDRREAEWNRNSNKGRLKMALNAALRVECDILATNEQRVLARQISSDLRKLVDSVYAEKRCPETGETIPAKSNT